MIQNNKELARRPRPQPSVSEMKETEEIEMTVSDEGLSLHNKQLYNLVLPRVESKRGCHLI